jgi:hypothetical protein
MSYALCAISFKNPKKWIPAFAGMTVVEISGPAFTGMTD